MDFIYVIDDTGFNTNQKQSELLKSQESCFCSVIIEKQDEEQLKKILNILGKNLKTRYNQTEFHFTDIYNRKGNFKNIEIDETLDIIETFTELFNSFDLKVVVSTINKDSYSNNQQAIIEIIKHIAPNMQMPQTTDAANLMLTIFKSKMYMEQRYGKDSKVKDVYCDEGLRKDGRSLELNLSTGKTNVNFNSSNDNNLLQLADFAAWMLTRNKHILDKASSKEKVKEWDIKIAELAGKIDYVNIEKKPVKLGKQNIYYDQEIKNIKEK